MLMVDEQMDAAIGKGLLKVGHVTSCDTIFWCATYNCIHTPTSILLLFLLLLLSSGPGRSLEQCFPPDLQHGPQPTESGGDKPGVPTGTILLPVSEQLLHPCSGGKSVCNPFHVQVHVYVAVPCRNRTLFRRAIIEKNAIKVDNYIFVTIVRPYPYYPFII